jgi:hypothetical protein
VGINYKGSQGQTERAIEEQEDIYSDHFLVTSKLSIPAKWIQKKKEFTSKVKNC